MRGLAAMLLAATALAGCGKAAPADGQKKAPAPEPAAGAAPATEPATASASATAPTGGQSLADGLRLVCEAPDKVTLDPAASGSDKATAIATYIQQNLHNQEAMSLMQEMSAMAPDERGPYLADTARKNGVARCPLAEMK